MKVKVSIEVEVPNDCYDCPLKKFVRGETYLTRDKYVCSMNDSCSVDDTGFINQLRFNNDKCPFKEYLPKVYKRPSDKQLKLVTDIESKGFPKCAEKDTAYGCYKYIEKYYSDFKKKLRSNNRYYMTVEDQEDYGLNDVEVDFY